MLIFEKSRQGRKCFTLPECEVKEYKLKAQTREKPVLPNVSELDLVRHYTGLSKLAHGVDDGFYPLGSCTMKYNPKLNEAAAALEGFTSIHPLQELSTVKGAVEALKLMSGYLCELTGMDAMTLQPAAGAHGEFTGIQLIKAYLADKGESQRTQIIVPDSAHGTNPASANMCNFEVVTVPSNSEGGVDIDALKSLVGKKTAGLMLTNPSTLGLFEKNILEITEIVHNAGGLVYYDGANLNAIMGITRPGDMGFDVVHLNIHKTLSTPHGMGGPGSGPVGCKAFLKDYLPYDGIINKDNKGKSIGRVKCFFGNFAVILKGLTYIMTLGAEGLKDASEMAVLNANYLFAKIKQYIPAAYERICMHEFVLTAEKLKEENGVSAMDISKTLLDYGIHPPTMYFPLIVHEALMFEPTETESIETLDEAAEVIAKIYETALSNPELLHSSPVSTPIRRVDEVRAARNPVLKFVEK